MISWPCLISPTRQKQQHLAALQCPVFSCLARKLLMFTYTLGLPLFGLALRSCQTRQKVMRGMQRLLFCFPKILSSSSHQPVTQQQPCGALLMDAHTQRQRHRHTDTHTHSLSPQPILFGLKLDLHNLTVRWRWLLVLRTPLCNILLPVKSKKQFITSWVWYPPSQCNSKT